MGFVVNRSGRVVSYAEPKDWSISLLLNNQENGRKEKSYRVNKTKVFDSLCKQWHERLYNLTFWTFSFKRTGAILKGVQQCSESSEKAQHTDIVVDDQKLMNIYFSKVLENLKKSYGLHSYIWVSERQGNNGVHYHCIFDIPKLEKATDFRKAVRYFKNSFRDYLELNNVVTNNDIDYCSIGFPSKRDRNGNYRGSVVRSLEALSTYLSGYLTKGNGKKNENEHASGDHSQASDSGGEAKSRVYAISRNILQKGLTLTFNPLPRLHSDSWSEIYDSVYSGISKIPKKVEPKWKKTYKADHYTVHYYARNDTWEQLFQELVKLPKEIVLSDIAREHRFRIKKQKIYSQSAKITQNERITEPIIEIHRGITAFAARTIVGNFYDDLFASLSGEYEIVPF